MSRFLRRGSADDAPDPAPAARPPSRRRPPSPSRGRKPQAETPAPPKLPDDAPPRRSRGRDEAKPKRAFGRRAAEDPATSAGRDEPKPEAKPRRGSGRRAAEDPAAPVDQAALLEVLDRQAAILGEQQQAIAKLAESQARLTEALLAGNTGDAAAKAQVEVLPRLAIFVDVPNILYAAEASGVRLDWGKVADFLARGRTLVRAIAYAPISDDPQARTENERFVVPFIEHGYRIATKPLKRFTGGSVKANFDVELAIDVLTMADRIDVIVLVSGDGDFRRLVEIVGSRGVRVEVMAFGQSTSSDLRQVADRYVDIAAHIPALTA